MDQFLTEERNLVVLGGVFTHLVFNRFNPHRPSIWLVLFLAAPISIVYGLGLSYGALPLLVLKNIAVLTLSVVLYRISPLHPLSHVPGPLLCKISNLTMAYHGLSGKRNVLVEKLHKRYGKIVRIGSDQVSFADAEAAKVCMGSKGLPRSVGYATAEQLHTPGSIMTSMAAFYPKPLEVHAERRNRWALGFTSKALRETDEFLLPRVDRLLRKVGEQEGVLDLGKWFGYFTFDFMGDLFFCGGFDMLNDQDKEGFWTIIEKFAPVIASLYYVPWLTPILLSLPGADDAPINKFVRFAKKCVDKRLAQGYKTKDVFYYIAGEHIDDEKKPKVSREIIENDVQTGIVGGSDTTASAMSNTIFALLMSPEKMLKLRAEVDVAFANGADQNDSEKLAKLPYLTACINETLRVYPPVQTRISRGVPSGHPGVHAAGVFLPENTSIDFPPRVIHRDPEYFSPKSDQYWPERWLADAEQTMGPQYVHNTEAFIPFSVGPANCVGRNLAMREMRLVLSQLIYRYDIKAANENKEEFARKWLAGLEDHQILLKGPLEVVLTPRSH
ncbi:high nitrogen upregulated cytochrome P450 monooxygenase 2 [Mycena crocata]|nr:high nitrogen upregulated cytochrome P450 monooxygenase 2 [Mycena crocata]